MTKAVPVAIGIVQRTQFTSPAGKPIELIRGEFGRLRPSVHAAWLVCTVGFCLHGGWVGGPDHTIEDRPGGRIEHETAG